MATHQKFVPVGEIDPALLPPNLNYRPEFDSAGRFIGLGKSGKDSYKYGFVCDVEEDGSIVKVRYDGMKKFDGPVGPNGHATPGAVMIVAELRSDGIYLFTAPEFRVFIYDDEADVEGVTIQGFAGGFTPKGKTPEETALDEVLEEYGIEVKSASVERIGRASDNRAMTETMIRYYVGLIERKIEPKLGDDEVIGNAIPVRVDKFHPGFDGIVDTAYAFLVDHFGLVKAK